VKEFPEQFVIRQTDYENTCGKPVECEPTFVKFDLQLGHGDFVKQMASMDPSEARFASKNFSSDRISSNRRVQIRAFDAYAKRQGIIEQVFDPHRASQPFYAVEKKDELCMERLAKKALRFDSYAGRSHDSGIYSKDWDAVQEPYDLAKVDNGKLKTTKGTGKGNLISLKKQQARDLK
jgi:hypothetical protein